MADWPRAWGKGMSVLAVRGLQFGYGARALFPPTTFSIPSGQCVALLGRNGAGKSALLKTLLRTLAPVAGDVLFDEKNAKVLSTAQLAAQVAYVPQRPIVPEGMTVNDVLQLGAYRFLSTRLERAPLADDVLVQIGMPDVGERLIDELSGGEQQRVMIGRALMQRAAILLLDEPAAHLDPGQRCALLPLFSDLCAAGSTVIFSTHFPEDARAIATSTILFERDCVAFVPTAQMSDDQLRALYAMS
jgi:iron complex transport system ATP-binding protein